MCSNKARLLRKAGSKGEKKKKERDGGGVRLRAGGGGGARRGGGPEWAAGPKTKGDFGEPPRWDLGGLME